MACARCLIRRVAAGPRACFVCCDTPVDKTGNLNLCWQCAARRPALACNCCCANLVWKRSSFALRAGPVIHVTNRRRNAVPRLIRGGTTISSPAVETPAKSPVSRCSYFCARCRLISFFSKPLFPSLHKCICNTPHILFFPATNSDHFTPPVPTHPPPRAP